MKDIEDFTSINSQNNFRGGFRRSKNSIPTDTFYKFRNIDKQEIQNKNNDAYLRQQLESLNEVNKNNQLRNKKLEEENKILMLKMKEMEQMIMSKNSINNKNEISGNKSSKRSSGVEGNEISIKLIQNSIGLKK